MPTRQRFLRILNPSLAGWLHNGTWSFDGVNYTNTPTLGSELLSNTTFDANTTSWTAVTATLASIAGGQSNNCLQITNTGSNGYAYQSGATAAGDWIVFSYYHKNGTSAASVRLASTSSGVDIVVRSGETEASFVQHRVAGQALGAATFARLILVGAAAETTLFDEVSMKKASLNTLYMVRAGPVNPSSIIATGTVQTGNCCGVVYGLDSLSSATPTLILAYQDGLNVKLAKCVAGTWTTVLTVSATSVAGILPQIKWTGGSTYQLWYNGTQRGADQTISDAGTGKLHGIFSTSPGSVITGFSVS